MSFLTLSSVLLLSRPSPCLLYSLLHSSYHFFSRLLFFSLISLEALQFSSVTTSSSSFPPSLQYLIISCSPLISPIISFLDVLPLFSSPLPHSFPLYLSFLFISSSPLFFLPWLSSFSHLFSSNLKTSRSSYFPPILSLLLFWPLHPPSPLISFCPS